MRRDIESLASKVGHLSMRGVDTIPSANAAEARVRVLNLFKDVMKSIPLIINIYQIPDVSARDGKNVIKEMFMKNKDIKDIAAIDQLCMYAEMELKESLLTYKTPYHIESILKADKINLETPESLQLSGQKPTSSFLKKFYSQGSN